MKYPIPNDWDGTSWCSWSICWPDSSQWRALLLGFITLPQRGRTWDERTGSISDTQLVGREITSNNLPLKECIMACGDSSNRLIDGLYAIATAIRETSCCGIASGPGYISDGEGGVYYGTEQPIDKPTTFGGSGDEFATESEFLEHLCSASNNIVAGIIASLNNWSIYTLASLIAGSLIVAVFVASPPLAVFLALALLGFSFGVFHTMANYVDEHRQEWVCALYNAASYSDMLVRVDELISDMVIDLDLGPFSANITEIIHAMLSTDILNKAYRAIGLPDAIGAVSCESCTDPCGDIMGVSIVYNSVFVPASGRWHMDIGGYNGDWPTACCFEVSAFSLSGYTQPDTSVSAWDTYLCSDPGSRVFHITTPTLEQLQAIGCMYHRAKE